MMLLRIYLSSSFLSFLLIKSIILINKVLDWFKESTKNNIIHTFYNDEENKDVYMIALRDNECNLIGYYEKHEYRNIDKEKFYNFNK